MAPTLSITLRAIDPRPTWASVRPGSSSRGPLQAVAHLAAHPLRQRLHHRNILAVAPEWRCHAHTCGIRPVRAISSTSALASRLRAGIERRRASSFEMGGDGSGPRGNDNADRPGRCGAPIGRASAKSLVRYARHAASKLNRGIGRTRHMRRQRRIGTQEFGDIRRTWEKVCHPG